MLLELVRNRSSLKHCWIEKYADFSRSSFSGKILQKVFGKVTTRKACSYKGYLRAYSTIGGSLALFGGVLDEK